MSSITFDTLKFVKRLESPLEELASKDFLKAGIEVVKNAVVKSMAGMLIFKLCLLPRW